MTNPHPTSATAPGGETKLHFLDYLRVVRVHAGIVTLAFLLVLITAAVVTYLSPRKYQSTASVELRPDDADLVIFQKTREPGDPNEFAPTQVEIIQRPPVLDPVIEKLHLQKRWTVTGNPPLPHEVLLNKLRSMMNLRLGRGTKILDVVVTDTDPDESAEIANAIVESYQNIRLTQRGDLTNTSLEKLGLNLDGKRKYVAQLQQRLADFRQQHPEIRDPNVDSTEGSEDPYRGEIEAKQQEADKYATQVASLSTKFDRVSRLSGDELMRALPTLEIPDPVAQKILPEYQDAVANEAAMLKSGLGPRHPKVASLRANIATLASQLTQQVGAIRNSLRAQLDVAKGTKAEVDRQLAQMREDQRKTRESSTPYLRLKGEYIQARDILKTAEQKASETSVDIQMPQRPILSWQHAEKPLAPSSPKVTLNLVLGGLVGLATGIGLAFFLEYLDTSVKTMDDVEGLLGVPVLAVVPKNIAILHRETKDVPDAEAYRILRTNVEFNRKNAQDNVFSMVSGGPGEGKSTTLCNLAYTCAQGGYSVLVVDADLRRPTQHKLFNLENQFGLSSYLTGATPNLADVIVPTGQERLSVLPSGPPQSNVVNILTPQRVCNLVAELRPRFDLVFFDSPPILGVSDAAVLASEVDQSILVVQHRRFPRAMLLRVKQAVTNVGGSLLGVVLNNVDLRHDPKYTYYTSYYGYYTDSEGNANKRRRKGGAAAPTAPEEARQPVATGQGARNGRTDVNY